MVLPHDPTSSPRISTPLVGSKMAAGNNKEKTFLFTSESVNEGHPDKLCDQVSDAILDACLTQDPEAKVACEAATKTGMIMVFGELNTHAKIDVDKIVREVVKSIGYDSEDKGLDYKTVEVINRLEQQSQEIANAVFVDKGIEDIGAGDQGIMFGYATNESASYLPLSHCLATRLGKRLTQVRKSGELKYLRPDGKTQVSVEYNQNEGTITPKRIHTIVISTQHDADIPLEKIQTDLMEHVIKPICPQHLLDADTKYHLNPSGSFVVGGPAGDAGLTGRKIIVDTYGGWGAHGGGAFSGKDPTKVDRSASYAARHIAKCLVAAKFCERVLVQVAYAIGVAKPLTIHIDSYGTSRISGLTDCDLVEIVQSNFDLRPGCILRDYQLKRPIYLPTACYGHFGRDEFPWEVIKKLNNPLKR